MSVSTAPIHKELRPRDYLAISVLWLAISLHWGALLGILLPSQVARFVDPRQLGSKVAVILGIGALVSTVMQLAVGVFSDRCTAAWGRRRPYILWGVLLNTIPLLLFARAGSFWTLVVAFIGIQVCLNVANGPYQALIPDLVAPERHGTASSYMALMSTIGQAGGLTLAGLLTGRHPAVLPAWSTDARVFLLALLLAAALLAAMIATILLVREQPWQPGPDCSQEPSPWKQIMQVPLRDHPDFAWLIASRFFINLGFYTVVPYLLFYVRDTLGMGASAERYTSLIFLIATVAGVLGNWPAGIWSDRTSKKRLVFLSCSVTAVAALLFLLTSSIQVALGTALLYGIGMGAFAAVDWALACNLLPKENPARWMGIWHFAFTVPQVIAPALVGPFADRINRVHAGLGWRFAMLAILVYFALGMAALTRLRERPVTPAAPR